MLILENFSAEFFPLIFDQFEALREISAKMKSTMINEIKEDSTVVSKTLEKLDI